MPRNSFRALLCVMAGATLLLAACEETNGVFEGEQGSSPDGINREAILNDLAEVRTLLTDSASQFPADAIASVEFNNGELTVSVTRDIGGLDEAEALCTDLSHAISASDVEITVVDEQGAPLATCRFQA